MQKILLLFLFFTGFSLKADILLSEIPDYLLQQNYFDLTQRALKKSCTSNLSTPISIPCNSISLIAIPEQKFFFANAYMSDNLDYIRTLDKLIDQNKDIELVESLLNETEPINSQISSSLNFTTNNFALSLVPYRATIFSVIRDPVNPRAATYAATDREVKVQYAYNLSNTGWILGANLKYLHREYVLDEFTLLDAIFDIDSILQKKKYDAFYIEPSIAYFIDNSWLPRFVLFVENTLIRLGSKNHDFSDKPIINVATGISPPLPLGFLELNLNISNNVNTTYKKSHTVRLGGMYSLGLMNLAFGIDEYDSSLGIFSTLWSARIGVLLEKRSLRNVIGEDVNDKSLLAEFSYIF